MSRRYRFDDVEVDLQSFRVLKGGKPLALEPKALNLLIFLVENRGRLVGRRELIDAVWNGAFVTDHVLNRAVGQLRRQLADDPKEPRYVETVPTLGYRFIATVETEAAEPEVTPSRADTVSNRSLLSGLPGQPVLHSASGAQSGLQEDAPIPALSSLGETVPASVLRTRISLSRRVAISAGIAMALALSIATFRSFLWPRLSQAGRIRSLAVLPLENLSGDGSQEFLADGVTDELITDLGQISALRVISKTTAMQYKGARKPLPQIARELNVDAVVEGSVLRSGDRIRIAARLVEAPTEKQLWAQNYEGDMRDVLGLQSRVASAVAEQIRVKVTAHEQAKLTGAQEVDPEAYEALLKGNYFFRQNSPETTQKSLQYFQKAVEIDPKFAPAYVGIARSYNFLGEGAVPVGEATAAADSAVAKALQLQPDLSEAYAERGWTLLFYHWDFPGAERDFRHALELNPGSFDAHEGYGTYQVVMGKFDEGLEEMKRARNLDPLSPFLLTDYCEMLTYARLYREAESQCLAAMDLDPHFRFGLSNTAESYFAAGDYAKANQFMERSGDCDSACIAMADEINGAPGKSGAFDSWLKTQRPQPDAFFLAEAYAGLGRKDEALASLEKAYQERAEPHAMTFTSVDPYFDSLRSDPRFDAFLLHAGLPPQPHTGLLLRDRYSGN
jgi:TolB-like protein/DNA-binding winged helix-turn-helix (wHTH) protein